MLALVRILLLRHRSYVIQPERKDCARRREAKVRGFNVNYRMLNDLFISLVYGTRNISQLYS